MEIHTKNCKISFFLPSLNIGGVENVFITYANELSCRGYRVEFALCKKIGDLIPLVSNDINIVNLGDVQLRYALFRLRKYIRISHPDILITGGDFPNMMLVLASLMLKERPQIILSKHNYQNVETKGLGWWAKLDLFLQKLLYPKADNIIAVSRGIEKYLIECLRIKPSKISQICNPIDIENVLKKGDEIFCMPLPDKYIVFVGRLGKVKNIPLLLKAFDGLDDKGLHLVIVGDGPERESLEGISQQQSSRDRIHFLGSVSNPMPIIKKSRTLVLCSFSEGYPTVLLEAMIFNIPIVATPTEGAIEILKNIDGTYILNSFTDINEMINCLNNSVLSNCHISDYVSKNEKSRVLDSFEELIM